MFDFLFGWRKASHCKKLIRRVQCRLKLLKNKRCSIVRQLRDDMAQLLKYGHDQSAFDRVEQLFKDESIVAVYDLLDNFCEFIIIHLSYIRKHRDCPNDINEAVSTLIFASARCGDLPELPVIRKLFGERYGQRFALVALELLPGNLVNRQIKENLSIKSVPADVKCRLVDEIARSCLQPGPLAIEYYSEVQQEQANKNKGDQVLKSDFQTNLVQDFNIVEGEGKIVHVIEPCHSQQGSDSTGGSISPKLLTWSVNRKEEGRVIGNYTHHLNSPYESRIPPPSVDKEVGMSVEASSDSSSQLPKDMIYLDDIEEFKSPMSGDQRLFMFRSSVVRGLDESNEEKFDSWNEKVGSRSSRKSRKASGKRERMRLVSREGISVKDVASIIYYEGSFHDSRNDSHSSHHRRKHHKKIPSYETQKPSGKPCRVNTGKDGFAHDCSLEDPCYFCTSDDRDDDFGSQKRRITTLEGFSVKEEKVEHRVCCPCCRCIRNGERNNQEAKWELVLQKPRRDYYNGQVPNEPVKKVEKADGFDHPPYLRTVTMPIERPSDCPVDNMLRSNSFPVKQASRLSNGSSSCHHVHPKLPDYDQLEAKFLALKKANMQCKSNRFTLAEA